MDKLRFFGAKALHQLEALHRKYEDNIKSKDKIKR